MRGRILTGLWTIILAALLGFAPAMAAEDHKAEAIKHAQAAAESGDAKAVGEHAVASRAHVDAALKEKPNTHLDAAATSLDAAIEQSKAGDAAAAASSANTALIHLKAAEKAF